MTPRRQHHPGVWALAVTAFAIGVAEFVVIGVLPALAADFQISLAQAGGLVGLYALSLAIGTPLLVLKLSQWPCKPVLLGLIAVFLVGNLASALAHSYAMLLTGRIITALAHGGFFAIGAMAAARLAPKGQSSRAIALMFSGLTLAMVMGVPLGSLIGNESSWRLPFFAVALLAALGGVTTLCWLPAMPVHITGRSAAQLTALACPAILAMMSVTVLGFGASFTVLTFITPILTEITGFSIRAVSVLLAVFGAATLVGNLAGGHWAAHRGWGQTVRWLLIGVLLDLIALALMMPYQIPVVVLLFLWGFLAFGMSPGFQAGMLATAERWAPHAVAFASALNIAAFNLGITLGGTLGSALVQHHHMALTPWAGVGLAFIAQWPLQWLVAKPHPTLTT